MPLDPVSTNDGHVAAHNEERAAINDLETDVATKITLPSNPTTGSVLYFNGTDWVKSVTRLFEDNGQPEGVVAAPIGSRYIQLDAPSGAVEWLKTSGLATDNTGWTLLKADTGWRDITADIDKRGNGVVNAAWLRRIDNLVDFYVDLTMPTTTTSPYTIYNLPVGFRPNFGRYGGIQDNRENAAAYTAVWASGGINLYGPINAGKRDRWNGQWFTDEAWPSVLPGL